MRQSKKQRKELITKQLKFINMEGLQKIIEDTTISCHKQAEQGVESLRLLKKIMEEFAPSREMAKVGNKLFNERCQQVASDILELCYLDEDVQEN